MDPTGALDTVQIVIGLVGGLALFLFGMEQLTDVLKVMAGSGMKRMLARLTTNRFKSAFAGAVVTAVIQSSSVTTVLVVGFISAGLMTLQQSIGVILGAGIGTTLTAQIVAFKVTKYGLVLVAVGFGLQFLSKNKRTRQYGSVLLGLGLIFFGMELMSEATRPLRSYEPFIDLMRRMDHPLLGLLVGTLFTGLIQSSSATMGVIIVLAGQGFISLDAGVALVFGANIGTCVTALLAALGKPREAVRAAAAHVLFKVAGVVLWFGFIDQLAWLSKEMSPAHGELTGLAKQAAEAPRQIANAHTIFNVANTFIFIWFTGPLVNLIRLLVPERPAEEAALVQPRYLDELLLDTPALALDRVRMELRRLGNRVHAMVERALPVALHGRREDLVTLARDDDEVDALYGAVVVYLGRLSREDLPAAEADLLTGYMSAANYAESIGDLIETNIVEAGWTRLRSDVHVSPSTEEVLRALHEEVCHTVQLAFQALDASEPRWARRVIEAKGRINGLAEQAEQHLARRLTANADDRLAHYRIESEIIEYLKRVYYFAKRIAKVVAAEPEAAPTVAPAGEPVP